MSRKARGCTVASESLGWSAEHRPGIASGPIILAGNNRFRFYDALGPMQDDSTVGDSIRLTRKSGAYSVESRGTLPFGVSPSVRHQHRYGGTQLCCTSDWRFPRNTQMRGHFSVGICELNATPKQWRSISATDQSLIVGDWQPWPESDTRLPLDVLAVAVEMADGTLIEVGLGEDLWRWRALSAATPGMSYGLALASGRGGTATIRRMAAIADAIEPPPRTYRFSWYASWQLPNTAPKPPSQPAPQKASWWSDGSLDAGFLQRTSSILIDLAAMDLPDALVRNGKGSQPCISAAGVQRRLKHAMRQIYELTDTTVPVTFSGWQPGPCCLGRHVDRKGKKNHWDWTAMLDFCAWSRNLFGPDRKLTFQHDLPVVLGDPFLQLEEMFDPMDEDELYS